MKTALSFNREWLEGAIFVGLGPEREEKAAVEIGLSAWLVRKIIPPHLCPGNTIQGSEMHFHLSPGRPQGDLPNRIQAGGAQVTWPNLRALESQQCLFVLWNCHLPGGMLMGPKMEGGWEVAETHFSRIPLSGQPLK